MVVLGIFLVVAKNLFQFALMGYSYHTLLKENEKQWEKHKKDKVSISEIEINNKSETTIIYIIANEILIPVLFSSTV